MAKNELSLTLGTTAIRQDDEGRYSLNDLHKAAGKSRRHEPGLWIRLDQTQALIREIGNYTDLCSFGAAETTGISRSFNGDEKTGISVVSTVEGRRGGTYVPWEMVYAYAMWVSPAFNLKVIRTFHEVVTKAFESPYIAPLVKDAEFRKGLKLKDRLTLQRQSQIAMANLVNAKEEETRRNAYWILHQVNTTLGIPMPTMKAMGIEQLRLEGGAQ